MRARIFVSGLVQGVFFRSETARRARALGLGGWVRNLADGRVEAVFEGNPQAVESMLRWCKIGPPMAAVESVEVVDEPPAGEIAFSVRSADDYPGPD